MNHALKNCLRSAMVVAWMALAAQAADMERVASPNVQVVYQAVLRNGFTVRHDHSEARPEITRLYLSSGKDSSFVDVPTQEIVSYEREEIPLPPPPPPPVTTEARPTPMKPGDLDIWVNSASDKHRVDADLIRSVIKAESGFNPRAVSPKGARGLMQLMPATATQLGVKDAFAPGQNVDGGTRYLRDLLVLYNNDLPKALAAYNAGPHRVEQYHGVPPYRETHAYVARIIKDFNRTKLQQRAAAKAAQTKEVAAKNPKPRSAAATQKTVSAATP
jgi:hypothetical protein